MFETTIFLLIFSPYSGKKNTDGTYRQHFVHSFHYQIYFLLAFLTFLPAFFAFLAAFSLATACAAAKRAMGTLKGEQLT